MHAVDIDQAFHKKPSSVRRRAKNIVITIPLRKNFLVLRVVIIAMFTASRSTYLPAGVGRYFYE